MKNKYNMKLFKQLNKEYENKKVLENFPQYDDAYQLSQADRRIDSLIEKMDFNGKRVLEIGCGGGYTIYRIAQRFDCEAVGIDIYHSPVWDRNTQPNLSYQCVDLGEENPFAEEEFDYIISYVAWEHMKHPFEVLQQATKLLKRVEDGGKFFLSANLYRSAIASHLYRTIYFPWPHLLFEDEIVIEYALKNGTEKWFVDAFYHLNKLTYAQYKEYFNTLNLDIESEYKTIRRIDYDFYNRFEDKLGYYPISDLELDFFGVYLLKKAPTVIRRHLTIKEVTYKVETIEENEQAIKFICEATGCDLEYAWYIFKDGDKIDTVWYKKENCLTYVPSMSGEYYVIAFVKDKQGLIKNIKSELIIWKNDSE